MTLRPYLDDRQLSKDWEALGNGVSTIAALAMLCSKALAGQAEAQDSLSVEAKAILFVAKDCGLIEIKGTYSAFERSERLLAVHVEQSAETGIVFRSRRDPRFTIRCLEGFRQLCAAGLVMHHLYGEFSLTERGYKAAAAITPNEVQAILDEASSVE